jgi:uncharacterized protein GlcG (DUF336 family)
MTLLTLAQAKTIAEGALNKGRELGLKPLAIAILDAGGEPVVLQRQDGAAPLRSPLAIAKAAGARGLGMSSRAIGKIAEERPAFFASLAGLAPLGIVPAAGGILIVDDAGTTIGAVGVSGDLSDRDEECALAGITAAGLRAQD